MKNELKISTLSIVCALCATAFSSAYGASTVRTLGGTGTYTSASAASASASNCGVARAGAVRVTPSSGRTVSTAKPSGAASTASSASRASTAPRLSLGKYLGTTTVNRPNGGTASGGSSNPGLSGITSDTIKNLQDQIDATDKQLSAALDAVDKLKDTVESIAIQGVAKDDYISVDENGIAYLDVAKLGDESTAVVEDNVLYITLGKNGGTIDVELPDLLSSDDMNSALEGKLKEYLTIEEFETWKDTVEVLGKTGDELKEALESKADVTDLAAKADKLTAGNYTVGNIATVGANGQYVDGNVSLDSLATDSDLADLAKQIGAVNDSGQVVNRFETLKTEINNNMTEMLENNLKFTEINANGDLVIKEGSITSRELAPNSVTSTEIAPGAVTSAEIATGAVEQENLAETITKQLIGDGYADAASEYPGGVAVMLVDKSGNKIWTPLEFATADSESSTGGND